MILNVPFFVCLCKLPFAKYRFRLKKIPLLQLIVNTCWNKTGVCCGLTVSESGEGMSRILLLFLSYEYQLLEQVVCPGYDYDIRFSFQKQSFVNLLTKSNWRVFVLKCGFNGVAMQFCWGHISAWVFCEFALYFQRISFWENLNLFFGKAVLCLIVHFKGTFTYFYHCLSMTHRFLIFYNFHWLFVSVVTFAWAVSIIQVVFFFFSIIEYDPNKPCFQHLE